MANTQHNNTQTALEDWNNSALEIYVTDSNSRDFLESLLSDLTRYDDRVQDVLEARHIDNASDKSLDRIGELVGLQRRNGEGDGKYRARIKASATAGNSGATFDDVAGFTASVLQIPPDEVEIDTQFADDPVAVVTGIDFNNLNNTNLTKDDFLEILDELVPAGHTTILEAKGSFEVSSDSYTPPSGTGLTDDSGTEGGRLAGQYTGN